MSQNRRRQQGATLVIALIMLTMITLVVVGAMSLSLTNLRVAGNLQFRAEATSAAQLAIEHFISTDFTAALPAGDTSYDVDINQDGTDDYTVTVPKPSCVSGRVLKNSELNLPDQESCLFKTSGTSTPYSRCSSTVWDVSASVRDPNPLAALTGASMVVHQGISKVMATALAASAGC